MDKTQHFLVLKYCHIN